MKTTIDIDEDILRAARIRACRENKTIGEVISALARRGLSLAGKSQAFNKSKTKYGFRPLPKRGGLVTNEIINLLRQKTGI